MDAAQDGHPPGAEVGLQRLRRLQGRRPGGQALPRPGAAPPPPWVSTAVQGWRGERASARASARRRSSSGGAESMADTGTALPSRQSSRVASRAAKASLPGRRARERVGPQAAERLRLPQQNPRLGPAQQLVTGEAAHIGPCHRLGQLRGAGAAEPRSQNRAPPLPGQSAQLGQETAWVKPTTRKLLGCTLSSTWASPRPGRRRSRPGGSCWWCPPPPAGPAAGQDVGHPEAPPISTSSPREMATPRPAARAERRRNTAAALLLTTRAASAPVRAHRRDSTAAPRRPRRRAERSYSRLE